MMEQYPLFFGSKERKRRLAKVLPQKADQNQFELSMMAVLTKAPVPDIRLITRQLLLQELHIQK